MSSKIAVFPLVVDHVSTLRDARTGRIRPWDIITQYGAPLMLGAVVALLGFRLVDAGQIVAGGAVLAAFSFGLAIFVFQLRLQAAHDPRIDREHVVLDLLDELFDNVSYSILAGLVLVALTIAGTSYTSGGVAEVAGAEPSPVGMSAWWTWAITSVALHYLATILMCLKRTRSAYGKLTI